MPFAAFRSAMQTTGSAYPLVVPPEIRRGTRLKWRLWLAGLLVVAVAGVALAATRPWKTPSSPFRTALAEKRNITQVVEATGHLDVTRRTNVPAPAPGSLLESLVRPGQTVKQGQPLARLDERAADIALRAARAELASARSREAQAHVAKQSADDVLARTLGLSRRGLASDSDVVAARLSVARARAGEQAARAQREVAAEKLAQAELAQKQHTLTTPVSGVVLSAPDSLGAMVSPQQGPLFVIGSTLDSLSIDAWVAEADIGQVRVGQEATFHVPAFPNRDFHAVVQSIGVDANQRGQNVRYLVTLGAENPDRRLLPGMTATLHIAVAHAEHVLSVREAALRFDPNGASADRSHLWEVGTDGKLRKIRVAAGVSDGAYTEVRPAHGDTLDPGTAVIIGRALPSGDRGPGISLGGR